MRGQCGMFYSLYWEYELKILRISVKLDYLGIYFTEKHARRRLTFSPGTTSQIMRLKEKKLLSKV